MNSPQLGFSRRFRLRKRRQFLRTQRRGLRLNGARLFVFMAGHRARQNRFGFTVSKKVGGAVVRNRVRRRLKEIVRTHPEAFPQSQCFVIVARPEAAQVDFQTLRDDVLSVAKQAMQKCKKGMS